MKRVLTGIKPTGLPHIGNYFGAIKPALELSRQYESFYFIADYHALTTIKDRDLMADYSLQIAAAWLALGLDPHQTLFYRQSDIPEIFEFCWILSCFASKGLLNRAHAYKAMVDINTENRHDTDHNINHGIFSYPVLMAADILLFQSDYVPVGADQKQHIEIARDIADAINHCCGPVLKTPEPLIQSNTQIIPGIDGQKMSKNYHNTLPIFLPEKKLRKIVMQIVTDSTPLDDPKDPDSCTVFKLFSLFNSADEQAKLANRYRAGGLGYGPIKQELFDAMMNYFRDSRVRYESFYNQPSLCNEWLETGAHKARAIAVKNLTDLKYALGIG